MYLEEGNRETNSSTNQKTTNKNTEIPNIQIKIRQGHKEEN